MADPPGLLIPFASASAPECRALLPQLALPHLDALLSRLTPGERDSGDDHSLSAPHERALARALDLVPADDGLIPWAAAHSGDPLTPQAWFLPCHFQVGMEQVQLLPAAQIGLSEAESLALMSALAPFAAEDGIHLTFDSAERWHASGEPLRGIACASLDRVSGRQVDAWMAESPKNPAGARLLKRLQSEAQMLFYTHLVNDAREGRRQLIANGFWVDGAGACSRAAPLAPAPTVPDTLRQAALRADWTAWREAWLALDAGAVARLLKDAESGAPVSLTLCGERCAERFTSAPRGPVARLGQTIKHLLGRAPAWKTLEQL